MPSDQSNSPAPALPMCVSPDLAAVAVMAGVGEELAALDLELGVFRRRYPELAAALAKVRESSS